MNASFLDDGRLLLPLCKALRHFLVAIDAGKLLSTVVEQRYLPMMVLSSAKEGIPYRTSSAAS